MKVARFVLKVVALALTTAAAVCCVIAFWDKITLGVSNAKEKIQARRAEGTCADYEDYADWDE